MSDTTPTAALACATEADAGVKKMMSSGTLTKTSGISPIVAITKRLRRNSRISCVRQHPLASCSSLCLDVVVDSSGLTVC